MDKSSSKWTLFYVLLVVALAIAVFASTLHDMLVQVYLKDIAKTFNVTVGTAGQIKTISAVVEVPVALILGFLTIRFKNKYLIMSGLAILIAAAIGVYFAPNFILLELLYPLNGVGAPIVTVVTLVTIGELVPIDKKGKSVGWALALTTLSYAIGVYVGKPIVSTFGSWRAIMPVLAVPATVVALVLVLFAVPSKTPVPQAAVTRQIYFGKFKQVLTNKSALGCMMGDFFRVWLPILGSVYGAAFFRSYWKVSLDNTILIVLAWIVSSFFGAWIGGQMVNWGGRKRLTVVATFLEAISVIAFATVPNLTLSISFSMFAPFISGIGNSPDSCLFLEQVPASRGPMMSLRRAFSSIGYALGLAVAGLVLDAFNYQMMGVTLGSFGLVSAVVFVFLTKEPIKGKGRLA